MKNSWKRAPACEKIPKKKCKGCLLRGVGTTEKLRARKLELIDIKCSMVKGCSKHCGSKKSFLNFQCKKGYRFADKKTKVFKAKCVKNVWTKAPKCVKAPNVCKGCLLNKVKNKEQLSKKNLILVDINCSKLAKCSEFCARKKSNLVYQCRRGYKFVNGKKNFVSLCKNGWNEKIPACKKVVTPGCPLRHIADKAKLLAKRNLVILDIHCKQMKNKQLSAKCKPNQSYIMYKCRKGFRFANKKKIYKSTCRKNLWQNVPKCVKK